MTLLSFWSKSPIKYGLSAMLVLFYTGALWIVLHPNVTPEYQSYYIDKTSHCFHSRPASNLAFMGKIRFGSNRPAQSCTTLIQGWSWQEPWGTWSDGPFSDIDFIIDSDVHKNATLKFHLLGFAPLKEQKVQLFLNQQFLTEWSLTHEQQTTHTIDIPISQANEKFNLSFYFETPLSLKWFGKSTNPKDDRLLTMGLLGFEWIPSLPTFETSGILSEP